MNEETRTIITITHALNILNEKNNSNYYSQITRIDMMEYLKIVEKEIDNLNNENKIQALKLLLHLLTKEKEIFQLKIFSILIKGIKSIWNLDMIIRYILPTIDYFIENQLDKSEELIIEILSLLYEIVFISKKQSETELKLINNNILKIILFYLKKIIIKPKQYDKNLKIKILKLIIFIGEIINLYLISIQIIDSILFLLNDSYSIVCINCIKVIEFLLIKHKGHEIICKLSGFRENNIVPLEWWYGKEIRFNYFGTLVRHHNYKVRDTFYHMIYQCFMEMPESHDYRTLLLSYLLSGLQDNNENIKNKSFIHIEQIGIKFEKEQQQEQMISYLFYLNEAEQIIKKHFQTSKYILPLPFKHRPCYGSRILITEHFCRIFHAILQELTDWKSDCRYLSLSLLRNCLIYTEEHITPKVPEILNALYNIMSNPEFNDMIEMSKECCNIIGKFVYPFIWIDFFKQIIIIHQSNYQVLFNMLYSCIISCPQTLLSSFYKDIYSIIYSTKLSQQNIYVCDIIQFIKTTINENENICDTYVNEDDNKWRGFYLDIVVLE
ncbi:hypothetical protein RFI_02275 [Reticulomyxa filosa]|uniref:Dynein axonemal assembly factor 5 HEAT-repeat domain-containing protein n=1 Tax=Reticulomyxa filosa TaxID=46433 RepID=X6P9G1_RETFI|nr:hypothetical protein RFI_02275 [Reticulomyxa filosa]|eukprot:ETO34811.1 hypothetical protein RFI_02275 [Reticulomyxa filosa]